MVYSLTPTSYQDDRRVNIKGSVQWRLFRKNGASESAVFKLCRFTNFRRIPFSDFKLEIRERLSLDYANTSKSTNVWCITIIWYRLFENCGIAIFEKGKQCIIIIPLCILAALGRSPLKVLYLFPLISRISLNVNECKSLSRSEYRYTHVPCFHVLYQHF